MAKATHTGALTSTNRNSMLGVVAVLEDEDRHQDGEDDDGDQGGRRAGSGDLAAAIVGLLVHAASFADRRPRRRGPQSAWASTFNAL